MRADTIRRLLVFGVCALGVSALYLVPGVRAPVASQPRNDRPTSAPLASTTTKHVTYETKSSPTSAPATSDATTATITDDPESVAALDDRPTTVSRSAAADEQQPPPPPVTKIRLDRVTPDEARISWPKAADGEGVAGYRISLNGFVIETTTKTSATVHWFNDDSVQQFVEVRTVDAAGHVSDRPARLLAQRPDPSATPSATPTPDPSTPTPSPDATTPSATSESSDSPAAKAGAAAEAAGETPEPGPTPGS